MTINYSKASWFLIIFLIWNIVSGIISEDLILGWSDIGSQIYTAFWIIWFFASLIFALIYIFDSRKNKTPNTRSRVADFLISFILTLASIFLFLILFAISAAIEGISLSGGFGGISFIASIPSFFLILTPFYFFILRHNWPSQNRVLNILIAFFAASFIVFLVSYLGGKYSSSSHPDTKFFQQK